MYVIVLLISAYKKGDFGRKKGIFGRFQIKKSLMFMIKMNIIIYKFMQGDIRYERKNLWAICLALLTLMGSGVPVNAAETDIAENELLQEVVSNVGRESKR